MEQIEIKTLNSKNASWEHGLKSNWIRVVNKDGGYIELIYREGNWEVHRDKSFIIQPTSTNHLKLRDAY